MESPPRESEELPLSRAAEYLLDECRMVLPGIQALLGFQLVAVFSAGFKQELTQLEQQLHFFAITLIVMAIAIIMTPAALHRVSPREVSATFISLSTRLLLLSMMPLSASISIDFYVVGRVILGRSIALPAAALFLFFITLWFVLPRTKSLQRRLTHRR